MIFANLPDIWDWTIVRRIQKRRNIDGKIDYHHNNFFHRIIDKIREKTLFWLPNWIYEKKAVLVEIIIVVVLFIGVMSFQIMSQCVNWFKTHYFYASAFAQHSAVEESWSIRSS